MSPILCCLRKFPFLLLQHFLYLMSTFSLFHCTHHVSCFFALKIMLLFCFWPSAELFCPLSFSQKCAFFCNFKILETNSPYYSSSFVFFSFVASYLNVLSMLFVLLWVYFLSLCYLLTSHLLCSFFFFKEIVSV